MMWVFFILVCLGALSYVAGTGLSIFFNNKRFVRNYVLGLGVGYAFYYNMRSVVEK